MEDGMLRKSRDLVTVTADAIEIKVTGILAVGLEQNKNNPHCCFFLGSKFT